MSKLTNYLEVSKPSVEFIVVAGDNYYPEKNVKISSNGKQSKTKIIKVDKLNGGFNLLPDNIPINMILGNHDLETNTDKKNLFIETTDMPETNDCFIIKKELEILKPNINYVLFKYQRVNLDTLWLMIDTSMYSKDINTYLNCYNVFLEQKGHQTFSTVDELLEFHQTQIINAITENMDGLKNIIISGHHPITGVKYDSDEDKIKILNNIPNFIPILNEICKLTNNNLKYYYLCADLHLYQKGLVELKTTNGLIMEINQYVVGTGGTELDDALPKSIELNSVHINKENIKYTMQDYKLQCGFLECVLEDNNDPLFTFISAEEPMMSVNETIGGKKNKTQI